MKPLAICLAIGLAFAAWTAPAARPCQPILGTAEAAVLRLACP